MSNYPPLPILTDAEGRLWDPVEVEYDLLTFIFDDHKIPADVDAWVKATEQRKERILNALRAGWEIEEKIICSPCVMLILSREKEPTP